MFPRIRTASRATALLAMVVLCLTVAAASAQADVTTSLSSLISGSRLGGISSIQVFDASTGATVWSDHATRPVPPASNEKLITSAAVLQGLGPAYRFTTTVWMLGTTSANGQVFTGKIYLRGGGDPTLSTAAFAAKEFGGQGGSIEELADYVAQLGITRIDGPLVVDDSAFDAQRYVASWKRSFRYAEAPALGALTVNHDETGMSLEGANNHTPDLFAGQIFASVLSDVGVRINGTIARGTVPVTGATQVGAVQSPPLSSILAFMDKNSDNFTAETLLKDLAWLKGPAGSHGSTALGAQIAAQELTALGVPGPFTIADGSGLSIENRTSAQQLSALLVAADRSTTIGQTFEQALAVTGGQGTLHSRLSKRPFRGRVHAKTGTLNSVSALSGFADSLSGHRYGFSAIMYSGSKLVPLGPAHALQDAIASLLIDAG